MFMMFPGRRFFDGENISFCLQAPWHTRKACHVSNLHRGFFGTNAFADHSCGCGNQCRARAQSRNNFKLNGIYMCIYIYIYIYMCVCVYLHVYILVHSFISCIFIYIYT